MRWVVGIMITLLGTTAIVLAVLTLTGMLPSDSYNSGRLVFRTEAEYGDFKEVLANPEISIKRIVVLSSAPPIIVDYEVSYPHSVAFPYGVPRSNGWGSPAVSILIGGLIIAMGVTIMAGKL